MDLVLLSSYIATKLLQKKIEERNLKNESSKDKFKKLSSDMEL